MSREEAHKQSLQEIKETLCERFLRVQKNFDRTESSSARRYWGKQLITIELELNKIQLKLDRMKEL